MLKRTLLYALMFCFSFNHVDAQSDVTCNQQMQENCVDQLVQHEISKKEMFIFAGSVIAVIGFATWLEMHFDIPETECVFCGNIDCSWKHLEGQQSITLHALTFMCRRIQKKLSGDM